MIKMLSEISIPAQWVIGFVLCKKYKMKTKPPSWSSLSFKYIPSKTYFSFRTEKGHTKEGM